MNLRNLHPTLKKFAVWLCTAALLAPMAPALAAVNTTTVLTSAANPVDVGTPVILSASVTGADPTGNVAFKSGTTTLATVALTGTGSTRTASYSATFTSASSKSLTAVYAGDAGNLTSISAGVLLSVNKLTSTTTLASATNPVTVGAPTVLTATVTGYNPTGNVVFKDGTTNLGTVALTGTGNTRTATYNATLTSAGAKSLTAVYAGDTNNVNSTSVVLAQTVNKINTSSTVVSSLQPATQGQSVTFTASVTGYNPTGNVVFKDGATTLSTKALSGTGHTRSATYANTTLTVGAHNITVEYAGNTSNNPSTSAVLAQTINPKAATSTALTSSTNPSTYGVGITLTANVTGGTSPGGTVTFKDGTTTLGTGTLSAGVATLATSTVSAGSRSLTAVYAGDTFNATSTSAVLTQVVNKATSSTTLTSSANPAIVGAAITLTANVTGGGTPTGTVTFKDGTTTLGTGTLSAGVATFATSTLSAGSHNLTAVYGGNTNNLTSTSTVLTQVVSAAAATSTTISVTPNPASVGQSVTFSASVSGTSPSGTVTFKDGSTVLGSATLSAGAASFSTSSLAKGGHSITANYGGDANNAASGSSSVLLSINAAGPGAMTWQYGYDAMGRPTTVRDPNALDTRTYYDSLGRPIQKEEPANVGAATPTVTQYAYNGADSLTQVTDPRNLATTYSPNGLGAVTAQVSPDTGSTQFTYDAKGNLLSMTDARGKVTQYSYDALDRPTQITYPSGAPTVWEYDGGATPTPATKGERTKLTDGSGSLSYAYDAMGRLTTKTQVTNGKTFIVRYTWGDSGSALDKLTAITYPSGSRVNYSYDAQGALTAVSVNPVNANGVGVSATTLGLLSTIGYNADNQFKGWSWQNGTTQSIGYDSFGQIASYDLGDATGTGAAAGARRTLVRDAAGRIIGFTHANNATPTPTPVPSLDQSFGYDDLNRLLNANLSGSSTQYHYDATGNRTKKVVGATTYNNTIDPASNRVTQTQDVGGTFSIQDDAAGHVTHDGVNSYSYSDRGRMSSATTAGGTVTYLYNGLELRVAKTGPSAVVPTGAAYYVYNEQGQLLGEYDANNNPLYETVYLGANPVGALKQTGTAAGNNIAVTVYNVHADHLGAPRVITRASDKAIVWRWDGAESFGGTAPNQNPNALGTFVYNQRFPGQVFDAETGLLQNWNREYDPRQGRYRQSDPIGLEGGINTYAYVEGNPVSYTDPTGEFIPQLIGFGIGAGLEYLTNPCASATDLLLAGGLGALGGGLSKAAFLRLGPRSLTRETGLEWSHSIARSTVNRHTSGGLNKALNQRGGLNGSWRTPTSHARHDASRHVPGVDPMPLPLRALDRIPDWLKGTGLGGGVGAAVAGGDCECR